jgi:hypothetical protein
MLLSIWSGKGMEEEYIHTIHSGIGYEWNRIRNGME